MSLLIVVGRRKEIHAMDFQSICNSTYVMTVSIIRKNRNAHRAELSKITLLTSEKVKNSFTKKELWQQKICLNNSNKWNDKVQSLFWKRPHLECIFKGQWWCHWVAIMNQANSCFDAYLNEGSTVTQTTFVFLAFWTLHHFHFADNHLKRLSRFHKKAVFHTFGWNSVGHSR